MLSMRCGIWPDPADRTSRNTGSVGHGVLVLLLGRRRGWCSFTPVAVAIHRGISVWLCDGHVRFGRRAQGADAAPALIDLFLEKLAERARRTLSTDASAFSAKKIKGRPAYELARKEAASRAKSVEVELFEFK